MTNAIVPHNNQNQLSTEQQAERLKAASHVANKHVSQNAFYTFRDKKSQNTLRAHDRDLQSFAEFLLETKSTLSLLDDLGTNPQSWQGIEFGLLETYKQFMLNSGYAISTINRQLSTIRKYAKLAFQADVISSEVHAKILTVKGFSVNEAVNVDEKREQTRITDDNGRSLKKADSVEIGLDAVARLKNDHDTSTPIGRRDKAIMALLLDHGLRASEIVRIQARDINLSEGTFTFYRPKTKQTDTQRFTAHSLQAVADYMMSDICELPDSPLFLPAKRNGELDCTIRTDNNGSEYIKAITTRTLTRIVNEAGKALAKTLKSEKYSRLSAHDCRHSWTTRAIKGSHIEAVKQAGGWKSYAMLNRYIDKNKITNEGVTLDS